MSLNTSHGGRILRTLAALLLLFFAAGCQCNGWGDAYSDCIDDFAARGPRLDGLYRAEHDLTRIGHPDWCASEKNRGWCPGGCCKSCCHQQ